VEIIFEKEKETKHTIRFVEKAEVGKLVVVGTLYVQKWFAGSEKWLRVKIEKGGD
jgi:hypothetical protein